MNTLSFIEKIISEYGLDYGIRITETENSDIIGITLTTDISREVDAFVVLNATMRKNNKFSTSSPRITINTNGGNTIEITDFNGSGKNNFENAIKIIFEVKKELRPEMYQDAMEKIKNILDFPKFVKYIPKTKLGCSIDNPLAIIPMGEWEIEVKQWFDFTNSPVNGERPVAVSYRLSFSTKGKGKGIKCEFCLSPQSYEDSSQVYTEDIDLYLHVCGIINKIMGGKNDKHH